MTMVRGQFNNKLFKGALDRVFNIGYESIPAKRQMFFNTEGDTQAEVQQLGMIGIGNFTTKSELGTFSETEFKSGLETRYVHVRYGLAMRVSKECMDDMKFGQVNKAVNLFGASATVTQEILAADQFNSGFSGTWNPGVAVPFFSAAHLLDDGVSTSSNLLTATVSPVNNDVSVTGVQRMMTLIRKTLSPRGWKMTFMPRTMILPAEQEYVAKEVLRSTDRPDTAERATNVISGVVKDEVWDYLTSATAWFVECSQHEMWWYNREALKTDVEDIAQTGGDKFYWAAFRMSCGPADWRGIYASSGT